MRLSLSLLGWELHMSLGLAGPDDEDATITLTPEQARQVLTELTINANADEDYYEDDEPDEDRVKRKVRLGFGPPKKPHVIPSKDETCL